MKVPVAGCTCGSVKVTVQTFIPSDWYWWVMSVSPGPGRVYGAVCIVASPQLMLAISASVAWWESGLVCCTWSPARPPTNGLSE